jgi:ATP-dependent DNA helicase RecQ
VTRDVAGLDAARAALGRYWGHAALRVTQLKVVGPVLAGRDVLAVLPTGAGKSLCFQIPALLGQGLTLVVSPLISLMQDQVGALVRRGIAAAYVNSTLDRPQRRVILDAVRAGQVRLLYCAPERLVGLTRWLGARRVAVTLLAIDEAHCIVEWGHEFRPVYRRLGELRYRLGDPRTVALTGSATPAARREIVAVLRLRTPVEVVASFDRPNLRFEAQRVADDRERFTRVRRLLRDVSGSAIVYAPTQRLTELITRALLRMGTRAAPYHAGLPTDLRRRVLIAFLRDRAPVVVATTAFGMGIDKPDVRRVIHWGPARTLEGYYQEAGRAGRDGHSATCTLLWTHRDWRTLDGIRPEMRTYVERRGCRRRALLLHFGERLAVPCGGCDRCGLSGGPRPGGRSI